MNNELLYQTVKELLAPKKGILAADESTESAGKRLRMVDLENTEENRRLMRDLYFSAPHIERYLSGVILYDETIRQNGRDGIPFIQTLIDKGILPGIKVDTGRVPAPGHPDEDLTEGVDGLRPRLTEYFGMGARFAKWRAAFAVADELPSEEVVVQNARSMAAYAALCQKENLVPIVEPEVLMDGYHSMDRAGEALRQVLTKVFKELDNANVDLAGCVLKTSMVLPGKEYDEEASPEEVAEATVSALNDVVPTALGGIVFLSGGQSPDEAAKNLNAIAKREPFAWEISFSYARAIQHPVLDVWQGRDENIDKAQHMLVHQLHIDSLADQGKLLSSELKKS